MPDQSTDKVRENRVRRHAQRLGYLLHKSRAKRLHIDNHGLYMLADDRNHLVLGARFDSDLDEVEQYLKEVEDGLR